MASRMRITRGKTGSRRSHHKLDEPRLSRDTETESVHLRHRVDLATGMYRGRKVIEVKEKVVAEKVEDVSTETTSDITQGDSSVPVIEKAKDTSKNATLPQQRKTQDKA